MQQVVRIIDIIILKVLHQEEYYTSVLQNYHHILEIDLEELEKRKSELKAMEEKYTDCCLRWYDIWIQYEDAFHSYHD